MFRPPSRKSRKHGVERLNLIPILDSVFIFIFFLLMSSNFLQIFEINSNIPIISNTPPPKNQKPPLSLTLSISDNKIDVLMGIPSRFAKSFGKNTQGKYDLEGLRNYLVALKEKYSYERTIIFEPRIDLVYEEMVLIMDAVRMLRSTDPAIFTKDEDGLDKRIYELFDDIIFGNIRS